MNPADNINEQIKELKITASDELDTKIHTAIDKSLAQAEHQPNIWRIIMKSKISKLAAAAAVLLIVSLVTTILVTSTPMAYAEVIQDAIDAVANLNSVYMKARMRTLPNDNFSLISLEFDFVDIKMWKRTTADNILQWRVEKPGRVLLMDGQSTTMLIRPNYGSVQKQAWPLGCYDSWMGRLLNVKQLLDNELQNAKNNPNREVFMEHESIDGQDKIILEVEVAANVPEDDYLRNTFINDSNHLKVFQFDANTKLLEAFQVYVHVKDEDILIFEITDIRYNTEFDDNVFTLDLPEDMIWYTEPQILPDNEKYENMTPKEAATAFFQACADENWDEFLKFWARSQIDERTKSYFGGLEIISIGEPFKSGSYPGWFVPYEIKFKPAEGTITLSKDNAADRFVITKGEDMVMGFEGKWSQEPEILPNNDYYAGLSASEIVIACYEALNQLDFDQMKKFMPVDNVANIEKMINQALSMKIKTEDIKAMMPVIEIVSTQLSEDGKTATVNILQSSIKKFNLAIRNDNEAHRWQFDGGI